MKKNILLYEEFKYESERNLNEGKARKVYIWFLSKRNYKKIIDMYNEAFTKEHSEFKKFKTMAAQQEVKLNALMKKAQGGGDVKDVKIKELKARLRETVETANEKISAAKQEAYAKVEDFTTKKFDADKLTSAHKDLIEAYKAVLNVKGKALKAKIEADAYKQIWDDDKLEEYKKEAQQLEKEIKAKEAIYNKKEDEIKNKDEDLEKQKKDDGEKEPKSKDKDDGEKEPEPKDKDDGKKEPEPKGKDDGEKDIEPKGKDDGEKEPEPKGKDDGEKDIEPKGKDDGEKDLDTPATPAKKDNSKKERLIKKIKEKIIQWKVRIQDEEKKGSSRDEEKIENLKSNIQKAENKLEELEANNESYSYMMSYKDFLFEQWLDSVD